MRGASRKRISVSKPFQPPASKVRAVAGDQGGAVSGAKERRDPADFKERVEARPASVEKLGEEQREAPPAPVSDGASEANGTPGEARSDGDASEAKTIKKQRVSYKPKEDCLVMQVVLGDEGLFQEDGGSKTERWVKITQRVKDVTGKAVESESLRKHVELLEKKYRKLKNKERKMSGKEPKKTVDQIELEKMLEQYVAKKDDENLAKAERAEIRSKKVEQDRVGGMAIRDAAMRGETRLNKPKKKVKSRSNPLEFLKEISKEVETRRAAEARERLEKEQAMHLQTFAFQEKQYEMQLQVAQMMAAAVQAMAKAVEKLNE